MRHIPHRGEKIQVGQHEVSVAIICDFPARVRIEELPRKDVVVFLGKRGIGGGSNLGSSGLSTKTIERYQELGSVVGRRRGGDEYSSLEGGDLGTEISEHYRKLGCIVIWEPIGGAYIPNGGNFLRIVSEVVKYLKNGSSVLILAHEGHSGIGMFLGALIRALEPNLDPVNLMLTIHERFCSNVDFSPEQKAFLRGLTFQGVV